MVRTTSSWQLAATTPNCSTCRPASTSETRPLPDQSPSGSPERRTPLDPLPGAVIFDLDDTLIVEEATARASYRAAADEAEGLDAGVLAETAGEVARELWRASPHLQMGRELGIASWEALWADFTGGHPRLDEVRDWVPAYREMVWRNALERCGGDPAEAPPLARAYIRAQRRGHPHIPGALELVRRLHAAGRPVGILTNGPPDIQRLKLDQLGIDECFSSIVISGEAGIGKPDPRVFEQALGELSAPPDDAVMIGDSWNRDVEGAAAAGMRSIWISNGRAPPTELEGVSIVDTTAAAGPLLGC